MKGPTYSPVLCSVCGRQMGRKPGAAVVLGLICDNPICHYQGEADLNQQRDAFIVAGAQEGVPVVQIAFASEMSRQRVYQILDSWKQGV